MKKILLIENQFTQFKLISNYIVNCDLNKNGEEYVVYPNDNLSCFKSFIDIVRIILNPRYGENKIELSELVSIIKGFSPQLIIIDHILVGNHQAEDGLDLALSLRKNDITAPFLFLSRTEQNNIEVYKKYPLIQDIKDWVTKGNSGDGFLTKPHFNDYVWPKIFNLITQSDIKSVNDLISKLLDSTYFDNDDFKSELFVNLRKLDSLIQPNKKIENILSDFISKLLPTFKERKLFFTAIKKIAE
ncbi:MAG: hypothetical protein NTZ69_19110 [Bacteroidia bacterium]|nr:hypothetical protein [Bacteroidia bacterium]